ncbi:glycine cleavage system aminomethyltransferase GcvT [Anthocerotibacter panamensis]|uniref:glycine cleavage system aminomethyltransferase GcvT n=1 Tax=Anthocerotibacter panamensis TaxID=2857077 RepID=UPI001C408259|nr:glycine cleavage system aminomethyltransferase GcvT [Anthocerotibacter panamensis]
MNSTPLAPYYPPHRLVEFAGWQMPVFFEGVLKEHHAVRQAVGLFDIAHMGKFILSAPLAELESLVPSSLGKLQPGQAQYTLLLNEAGGILDDVIFYYLGGDRWRVIVNAATRAKDFAWIQGHLALGRVHDESDDYILLALQGPKAGLTLQQLCTEDLSTWERFGHGTATILGQPVWLARTGYTGEDGFEILLPSTAGITLWQELLSRGCTPCGLGCRDSLRLEAAMHLYGQDMDEQTNPLEAGLGWVIGKEKRDFIGREALERAKEKGLSCRLVGLQMQGRGIARHGYEIVSAGEVIGVVTSGGPSPTLNCNIALGYVPAEQAKLGTQLAIRIRNQEVPAVIVKRPFYKRD